MKKIQESLIQRCFDLSRLGKRTTSPNPTVGAVLYCNDKIIGEGYHEKYGESHAEVNAVKTVPLSMKSKIKDATLYVSLEPCNIVGNTPACTNLIIDEKIKEVFVSVIDQTEGVNNAGITKLRNHKINVQTEILKSQGERIAKQRNTFVSKKRPYIILKWAESADGYLSKTDEQTWLTNQYSKRLVHKWRAETDAIIVGTNTVLIDDPSLTTRLYPGRSPTRILIDKKLKLPKSLKVFDRKVETWVFNNSSTLKEQNLEYFKVPRDTEYLDLICAKLYERNKASLIVEGGRQLLNAFIANGLWDEIRCFKTKVILKEGIPAPLLYLTPDSKYKLMNDELSIFINKQH